jgi:hypothetical protein
LAILGTCVIVQGLRDNIVQIILSTSIQFGTNIAEAIHIKFLKREKAGDYFCVAMANN